MPGGSSNTTGKKKPSSSNGKPQFSTDPNIHALNSSSQPHPASFHALYAHAGHALVAPVDADAAAHDSIDLTGEPDGEPPRLIADEDELEHKASHKAAKRSAASASLDGPPGTSTALGHVLCSHGDCRVKAKSASGNYISIMKKFKSGATAGPPHFCITHGGGRRCSVDGCDKSVQGGTAFCRAHGGGAPQPCSAHGCENGARGGSAFCSSHGGGARCSVDGCDNGAQGGTAFCSGHGGGPRCSYPDCQSGARSKDIGLCATHGGGKIECLQCSTWQYPLGPGKAWLDEYCQDCFAHKFPLDPRNKQIYKRGDKERVVQQALIKAGHTEFVHDKVMWVGCSCAHKRRIDFRQLVGGTLLALEVDENQHRYYDGLDKELRYHDIAMVHGGSMVFIHFNPDPTKYDKSTLEQRLPTLLRLIDDTKKRIEEGGGPQGTVLEIIKLYYS